MSGKEIFEQLSKFEGYKSLSDSLSALFSDNNEDSKVNDSDEEISNLRNQLQAIEENSANNHIKIGDLSLTEAAFNALLLLAELKPLDAYNQINPDYRDAIADDQRVYISTGHVFNIKSFITSHNKERPELSLKDENNNRGGKWLINPHTQKVISARDTRHVLNVAKQNSMEIEHLFPFLHEERVEELSEIQLRTLEELYPYDLKVKHLLEASSWFNTEADPTALNRLIKAIKLTSIPIDQALAFLNDLHCKDNIEEFLEFEFNDSQIQSLITLSNHGLTMSNLKEKPWFNGTFHSFALSHLVTRDQDPISIDTALDLLDGLNMEQLLNITGLSELKIRALKELYSHDLRGWHLQEADWFTTEGHLAALRHLVTREHNPISSAVKALEILTDLDDSLLLEITGLSELQIKALTVLYPYGLRGEHLQGTDCWFTTENHLTALHHLMMTKQQTVSVNDALRLLIDLNASQLVKMTQLDEPQIRILTQLHNYGLKQEHLRDEASWFNTESHYVALHCLMTREENPVSSVAEALKLLKGLDGSQLPKIMELNELQISTLKELYSYGLTATHLKGTSSWFRQEEHRVALHYLMKKHIPIESLMPLITSSNTARLTGKATSQCRIDTIKAACEAYLTFRTTCAPGHRFNRRSVSAFFSYIQYGKDGMRRVENIIFAIDRNASYGEVLALTKTAYAESATNKNSFKRYLHDTIFQDSKTVGEEITSDILRKIEGADIVEQIDHIRPAI